MSAQTDDDAPAPRDSSFTATAHRLEHLIEHVKTSKDYSIRLENPDLAPCWEVKACDQAACPCYGKPALRCWQVAGTHCAGEVQGGFALKLGRCESCEVFGMATRTTSNQLTEAFHNMLEVIDGKEKALHDSRVETEAAERVAAHRTSFLTNMSHEIRTPMNGILGMADVLAETSLTSTQREFLDVIRRSGDVLLRLLDDVLDFSKIEAGRLDIEHTEFDLPATVEAALELFSAAARNKCLELTCRFGSDVPETVIGDSNRLSQVLSNLIGNAIKFTESGEIAVEVSAAQGEDVPGTIAVSVRDTGIGIDPHKMGTIFRPWEQADSSTTRKYGGTGLGLAICSRLVAAMGGTLSVESKPGSGSTFRFTVVVTPAGSEPGQSSPSVDLEQYRGLRALIVDDNGTNRTIMRELLTRVGLSVAEAESGAEGLEQVASASRRGEAFSLVVLDRLMPGMDGNETARSIRQHAGCEDVPILMASSSKVDGAREEALASGCSRYLTKPVRRQTFLRTVSDLMASRERRPDPTEHAAIARILVVDDNRVNRLVTRHMLASEGYEIASAEDGAEAIRVALAHGPFDLVLMDVQMPGMDGLEATRQLRADPRTCDVPVVGLTAHAFEADRVRCIEAGMCDHLAKPVRRSLLLGTVRRLLGLEAAPSSDLPGARPALEPEPSRGRPPSPVAPALAAEPAAARAGEAPPAPPWPWAPPGWGGPTAMQFAPHPPVAMGWSVYPWPAGAPVPMLVPVYYVMQGASPPTPAVGFSSPGPTPQGPGPHSSSAASPASAPAPVDPGAQGPVAHYEEALSRCGGSEAVLLEVLAAAREEAQALTVAMRDGVTSGDRTSVRGAAHALCGAVSNVGASRLVRATRDLEQAAMQEAGPLKPLLQRVEVETTALLGELSSWAQKRSAIDSSQ